jgi:hypothetical protein
MIIKFAKNDQAAWIDIISLLLSVIPRLQNQASWMYFTITFIEIIIQLVFDTLIDSATLQCWFGCFLQNK